MKKILITALAITGLLLSSLATTQAGIIPDNYIGPTFTVNGTEYSDVDSYAGPSSVTGLNPGNVFDLFGYSYSVTNNTELTLVIYAFTSVPNNLQFSYFHPNSGDGISKWGLGDLFIATVDEKQDIGEVSFSGWDYVVDLDYPMKENEEAGDFQSSGAARLFAFDKGTSHKGTMRKTEPYAYFTPNNPDDKLESGRWGIAHNQTYGNDLWDTLTITIDLDSIGWYGTSDLLMQFTQVCANDILRMEITGAPVPEPSTLLLFGSGLLGLAGFARRRHNN